MANLTDIGWSLCIATLNRQDALLRTLAFAAAQTCPPRQIVVVDVSDDWQDSRARAEQILAAYPGITLDYRTSDVRSSAVQRNRGLACCTEDIVFMIDDDSFMHADCAEQILKVYAADTRGEVVAVAALLVGDLPPEAGAAAAPLPERKASGRRSSGVVGPVLRTRAGRWFNRKILLQNKDELFLKYDEPRPTQLPAALAGMGVERISFMPGSAMTVRRAVALAEPFDPSLRYYAAFEDLDVAYRYGRHGAVVRALKARLHHYEAAGGRLKRKKLVIFQLLNMAVFLKRHANPPGAFAGAYRRLIWRRLLGEALKDLLARRWDFPQMRGVLVVMRSWRQVWDRDIRELDIWYPEFQKAILEDI